MKRIKKIAASIMAIAITAAGMSSIPASALYTSRSLLSGKATAAVSFQLRYSYGSTTSSYNNTIRRLCAECEGYQNGVYFHKTQNCYGTGSAYVGQSGSTITSYRSYHTATTKSNASDSTTFVF